MSVLPFPTPLAYSAAISVRGDAVLVTLTGELDVATARHVEDYLSAATALAAHVVIVDLSLVTFVDSSGLQGLIRARSEAFGAGVALVCAAPGPQLSRTLTLIGGDQIMPTFGSVASAVHRYSRERPAAGTAAGLGLRSMG